MSGPPRERDATSRGPGQSAAGEGKPARRLVVSRRRAVSVLAAVGAVVLLADLVTKQLAVALLAGSEPVRLLGGAIYLVYATNSGAAFSIGSSHTYVFPFIAFAVIAWIGWMAWRLRSLPWAVALGLVLGGAAGNLTDRLFRPPGPLLGEVVDMVSLFDPYGRAWPVFNVADSALVLGVALVVWLELTGRRRDGTRADLQRPDKQNAGGAQQAPDPRDARSG
jgi:signal peptidase II